MSSRMYSLEKEGEAECRDLSDVNIQVAIETLWEVPRTLYQIRKAVAKDRAGQHEPLRVGQKKEEESSAGEAKKKKNNKEFPKGGTCPGRCHRKVKGAKAGDGCTESGD